MLARQLIPSKQIGDIWETVRRVPIALSFDVVFLTTPPERIHQEIEVLTLCSAVDFYRDGSKGKLSVGITHPCIDEVQTWAYFWK